MAIVATFKGAKDAEGNPLEYLGGIPSRSLDEDDWKALTDEQKATVKASAIYRMADSPKASAPRKPTRGKEVPLGETATITGDGSGEALPDFDPTDQTERTFPPVATEG